MAHDPFKTAARRIVRRNSVPAVFTRYSDGERISVRAVLDLDVEITDELGNIIDRDDMISLLSEEVGVAKSRDTVVLAETGVTYTLGRTVRDDGYVIKLMAHRNG